MTENSEDYDVEINDGGVTYYYALDEDMTVEEIATEFLLGYDGTGKDVRFELYFPADGDKFYAEGRPNEAARIYRPVGQEADQWLAGQV